MNESESGAKRAIIEQEETNISTTIEPNKKQKLSNEGLLQQQPEQQITPLPVIPNTALVLDKAQQDTINQLVQNTHVALPLEAETTMVDTQLKETNKNMEQEIVSADIKTAVTPDPTTTQEKTTPAADDLKITSEQLLFALTSVPPTEQKVEPTTTTTTTTEPNSISDTPVEQDKSIIVKKLLTPVTTEEPKLPSPPLPTTTTTPPLPVAPTAATAATTGLGITPNNKAAPPPSKPNQSPSLTNALTNLPDISAALRRLSSHTVPASVIEQLSSSPRLPHILNTPNTNNERRPSSTPSEILGNALAAVAANAAAASRSSPKQPQPQTNAATAIGNLAAITANISNLLHSGGFHRNSFSQEDTQKLAAAVARHNNNQPAPPQQRRKSSMATNAFSNMIEMMGRNKPPPAPKPKLIIKNDQVWKSLEGLEEKHLGYQLYTPHLVLPNLEKSLNGLMEIRVPARYLTFDNTRVKKRALWGTDIYTDDSDIVAMTIHSGKYEPQFVEREIDAGDPFALAIAGKQREALEATKKVALSGKKWVLHDDHLVPNYDLKVIVRVLPTLKHYASSIRHKIKSREWTQHDGMSLFVVQVEKIKRGEARLRGRSSIKSTMFAFEEYRKQALGLNNFPQSQKKLKETPLSSCRNKKSPRVMRMFQIRSEMLSKDIKK